MSLFTVYMTDGDDEGCVRLHINTDISYSFEAADRLSALIEGLNDDSGEMDDLRPKCKRCDTLLDTRGLCRDETCPHSDRPQDATWTEE